MVTAGRPFAELDVKRERAASLAVAEEQKQEVRVNVFFTARNLSRKEALFQSKAASAQSLDDARQNAQLGLAGLEEAKRQQAYAQVMLDQATIRAPTEGMVLRILKHEGEGLSADKGLIEFGQVEHMEAVAGVFDTDLRFVKPGQKAEFTSPAIGRAIEGKVLRIVPKVDRFSLYPTNAGEDTEDRIVQCRRA